MFIMIKNIIRFFSVLVILVILISTLLTTWTSYVFLSNNSKRSEIKNLIGEIYISQKSILFNFIDLSKILVKNEEPFKDDSIIIEQEIENLLPDSSLCYSFFKKRLFICAYTAKRLVR